MRRHSVLFRAILTVLLVLLTAGSVWADPAADTASEAAQSQAVSVKKEGSKSYLIYTATGQKVTGYKKIAEVPAGSGNYYYFRAKTGRIYTKSWIKSGKNYYYAKKNGKLNSGLTKMGKKTYYFDPATHARVTGWKKLEGKYYYFNEESGVMQKGFKKVGKYTYYLDTETGARATGWTKISGKWYYFTSKGRMKTGLVTIDGNKYYLNENGVRKTGLVTINGAKYYFDKSNGGAMATGWVTRKNKTYYFNKKGTAVTGWLSLSGKKYYFNSAGVLQKGWLTLDGGSKKYYLDTITGAMLTGKQTIDGKTYDFGTKGYLTVSVTGPWSIKVNQGTCVVTVYRGNTAVRAMLCSPGRNGATPNGTFSLGQKRHWHALFGGVYGQYTSVIYGNYLFHSVYYYQYRNPHTLATAEYNKLGSPASAGCVRLNCADAYYIYTNCPVGTKVTIFRGTAADDPLPRPQKLTISTNYDPTDPIPND